MHMKELLLIATLVFAPCASAQVRENTSGEAATHFGKEMARAFNERDAKLMGSLIDLHTLGGRAAKIQSSSESVQAKSVREFESGGTGQLSASFFRPLDASDGSARFMRV